MKCSKKETRTIEGDHLYVSDLDIGGKKHALRIGNEGSKLSLAFGANGREFGENGYVYQITVDENGIGFERYVHRPNHDHSDIERLLVVVDPRMTGSRQKGDLVWESKFPYEGDGYAFYYVPFGAIERDD